MFISFNIDSIRCNSIRNFVTFDFMRFLENNIAIELLALKRRLHLQRLERGGVIGTVVDNCIDLVVR